MSKAENETPYPTIGELLGEKFCKNLFGKDAEKLKGQSYNPHDFFLVAERYLTRPKLILQLIKLCGNALYQDAENKMQFLTHEKRCWYLDTYIFATQKWRERIAYLSATRKWRELIKWRELTLSRFDLDKSRKGYRP